MVVTERFLLLVLDSLLTMSENDKFHSGNPERAGEGAHKEPHL